MYDMKYASHALRDSWSFNDCYSEHLFYNRQDYLTSLPFDSKDRLLPLSYISITVGLKKTKS
jgi:hypothetical protein